MAPARGQAEGLRIRRWTIVIQGVVLLAVAAVAIPAGALAEAGAPSPPRVFVTSWDWEVGDPSTWSVYVVRVANRSDRDFVGEVVLAPAGSPEPGPGGAPADRPAARPAEAKPATTHRVPLALAPGVERNVAVPLLVTRQRYRAEVRDRAGRLVSRGEAIAAPAGGDEWVGLLTDVPTGRAFLPAASRPPFRVSQRFASARDFPEDAALLLGLRAVVIVDFDSAGLSRPQLGALRNFVALGGSLVLGGGAAAGRTVLPLPEAMTPLRPDATATASLAVLADLAGRSDGGSAVVATGAVSGGQVVLWSPSEGVPLVVEGRLGMGRIVQLAYDPLEQLRRPGPVPALVRDHALTRAGVGSGLPPTLSTSDDVGEKPPGPTVPEPAGGVPGRERNGLPGLTVSVLAGYALLVGPGVYGLLRHRGRTARLWTVAPTLALFSATVAWMVVAVPWRPPAQQHQVQVRTVVPDGTARVESYGLVTVSRPGSAEVVAGPGALASPGSRIVTARRLPGVLGPVGLKRPEGATAPSDARVQRDGDTRVAIDAMTRWDRRPLRTASVTSGPIALEGDLRLASARLAGRITNAGDRPVRNLGLRTFDGTVVDLGRSLAPGASLEVAAPLPSRPHASTVEAGSTLGAGSLADDAAGAATAPGWVQLVGLTPVPSGVALRGAREATTWATVVVPIRLRSADTVAAGLETPRLVCLCGPTAEARVLEFELPTGAAGPVAVAVDEPSDPAGTVEAYGWSSGRWRPLPVNAGAPARLEADEVRDGRARVRTSGPAPGLMLVDGPP